MSIENKIDEIIIGYSDYTLKEIKIGGVPYIGSYELASIIEAYENAGYKINFKTSLFRSVFCLSKYEITAILPTNQP